MPFKVDIGMNIMTYLVVKSAEKPWLNSWPIDIRLHSPNAGKMLDCRVPTSSWGKGKRAVWDAWINDPFSRPTRIPFEVEDLLA